MSVPFTPTGDRVVVKADIETRAPDTLESGLVTALTLAAAVEGSDAEESWFVGTVIAVGPMVNRFEVRPYLRRRCQELGRAVLTMDDLDALPAECPDPVKVGDRVTFSWASGHQLTADGERYLILRAGDVLAVLESEAVA